MYGIGERGEGRGERGEGRGEMADGRCWLHVCCVLRAALRRTRADIFFIISLHKIQRGGRWETGEMGGEGKEVDRGG